jgi:hypothetical protein
MAEAEPKIVASEAVGRADMTGEQLHRAAVAAGLSVSGTLLEVME